MKELGVLKRENEKEKVADLPFPPHDLLGVIETLLDK
jgi:hypothetical protein